MSTIASFHGIDPRGGRVGGIETHVRQVLARHPADMRILLVGVDGIGDLEIGRPVQLEVDGRIIDFLPVMAAPEATLRMPAKRLLRSLTLRFALACLRCLPAIRKAIGDAPASAEVQRAEFILAPRLLGLPTVMLVHNEFTHKDRMDSLLKRYWGVFRASESLSMRLANAVYGVNPAIVARLRADYPFAAQRTDMLTVSVDSDVFAPAPFDVADGVLRMVYAGRLDGFKDPDLMFDVAARLHAALGGAFEFHYAGGADPGRFAGFARIRPFTVLHGALDQAGVAALLHRAHMGILTSYFEGMPCFLLELLASGRPLAGLHLPQFDGLVVEGVSGSLVRRVEERDASAASVCDAALALWAGIRAGNLDPQAIAACAYPYSVSQQLGRLFARHRQLAGVPTPEAVMFSSKRS